MTPAQIKKRADQIDAEHRRQMENLSAIVYEQHVKPFCERLGVKFCAGMGGWHFEGYATEATPKRSARAMADWDSSDLPKTLVDLLHIPVSSADDLGSIMCDYMPKSYKPAYTWGPNTRLFCVGLTPDHKARIIQSLQTNRATNHDQKPDKIPLRAGSLPQCP